MNYTQHKNIESLFPTNLTDTEQPSEVILPTGLTSTEQEGDTMLATNENSNRLHIVAPGEGKTPINLMYCEDWEIKAFPILYPDGRNHLSDDRRSIKLNDLDYFKQRLFSKDTRWRNNTLWVFA